MEGISSMSRRSAKWRGAAGGPASAIADGWILGGAGAAAGVNGMAKIELPLAAAIALFTDPAGKLQGQTPLRTNVLLETPLAPQADCCASRRYAASELFCAAGADGVTCTAAVAGGRLTAGAACAQGRACGTTEPEPETSEVRPPVAGRFSARVSVVRRNLKKAGFQGLKGPLMGKTLA